MGFPNRDQVTRLVLLALLAATVCSAQNPAPAPVDADQPAQPAVSADAPILPPKVVCTGNQITISANNSTLISILDEVHRCMGTKIDIPDSAGSRRIFDRIGPGPASQVLDELLSATGYNYVIGSSPANQEKIESIMLLARSTDAAGSNSIVEDARGLSPTPSRRAFLQMHQASLPHPMTDADNAAAATATPAESAAPPEPAAAQPAATGEQPAAPDSTPKPTDAVPGTETPAAPAVVPVEPPASNGSSHPPTTQDQINNMQQMFELRKQLNQQNQANPPQK